MDKSTVQEIASMAATGVPIDELPVKYALVPAGMKLESLENWQFADKPMHKKTKVQLETVASFLEYWNLFKNPTSRIFAKRDGLTFTARLDYHEAGENGASSYMHHVATLKLKTTEEFDTWMEKDKGRMSQSDFVEFIEDNAFDVISPSSATMTEIARDMSVKADVNFQSAVRTSNGSVQLGYQEEVKGSFGTGKIDIPEIFRIKIQVFEGGPACEIDARLKFRLNSGKLTIWYELIRAKKLVDKEFEYACTKIGEESGTTILMGGLV